VISEGAILGEIDDILRTLLTSGSPYVGDRANRPIVAATAP
jgi:hypothetical protein